MRKMLIYLVEKSISGFLVLTFLISAISFLMMLKIPGSQTPESSTGLPIWLIAIWSPSISAIVMWAIKKKFISSIQLAFSLPNFSWWMLLAFIPLAVTAVFLIIEIKNGNQIEWSNFKLAYLFPLIFINLMMGPLGEELGWRAFLYPVIKEKYGWMASALIVGIIWTLWHSPLWFLDSPQSKIPFWAFSINVIFLSILMSMIYNHSAGSIIFIILLHLTFNISLGIIEILSSHSIGEFVVKGLYIYVPMVILLVCLHECISPNRCNI
ncbi:lysostaphin resistance A-like protein [Aquiflexum sp.]|uniref:CPBP family intramembrane glutamic endopeptidase n=1 Tax=Aquiflexum sp. TaxID=1872584 RepID=UPI0035948B9A